MARQQWTWVRVLSGCVATTKRGKRGVKVDEEIEVSTAEMPILTQYKRVIEIDPPKPKPEPKDDKPKAQAQPKPKDK